MWFAFAEKGNRMQRHEPVRLCLVIVVAVGVLMATPCLAQPSQTASMRERLERSGYGTGDEALAEALAGRDPVAQSLALTIAALERNNAYIERARELVLEREPLLRFQSARYLASFGEREGTAAMRLLGEMPRETLLSETQQTLQRIVIEAARSFAEAGDESLAYQLALLIDGGAWPIKHAAAAALADFRGVQNGSVESVWLLALEIVSVAAREEDERIIESAGELLRIVLRGLGGLQTTTPAIIGALRKVQESGVAARLGVPGVRKELERQGSLESRAPAVPAPNLLADPREMVEGVVVRFFYAINEGEFEIFDQALDFHGVFEGLPRDGWIDKMRREHGALNPLTKKHYIIYGWSVNMIGSERLLVDAVVDVQNEAEKRWDRTQFRMLMTWFGFGWHFSRIDRSLLPEDQQPYRDPPEAEPPAEGEHAEAGRLAQRYMRAMRDRDERTLVEILDPGGSYLNGADLEGLLQRMRSYWSVTPPGRSFVTPIEYRFRQGSGVTVVEISYFSRSVDLTMLVEGVQTIRVRADPAREGGMIIVGVEDRGWPFQR